MQHTTTAPNFIKEWRPFDSTFKAVKMAIRKHFNTNTYNWQPTHDKSSTRPFKPVSFLEIDNILGLAYTSGGECAGLWTCNSGYLWADSTHYFYGFAISDKGDIIALAKNEAEQEIFIKIGQLK